MLRRTYWMMLTCFSIALAAPNAKAVVIDFEDVPVGSTYEPGDTFAASGVEIAIDYKYPGGEGPGGPQADPQGRIYDQSTLAYPCGSEESNNIFSLINARATFSLDQQAVSIRMDHYRSVDFLINQQMVSLVGEVFYVFDDFSVVRTFRDEGGTHTEITGNIDTFAILVTATSAGRCFDNIAITYVPEPTLFLIFGCGLLLQRRRL